MTELSKTVLDKYQVRKTKKQKEEFFRFLQTHIPQLQVQEGGFPRSRNLMIGDPDSAKVILGAHYDTCAQLLLPNFITPKRPLVAIAYSILMVVPYLLLIFIMNLLLGFFSVDPEVHYLLSIVVYGIFMGLMLLGPANRHTANDNTSGVITLLEIYQQMDPKARESVCFVLFDNEEKGLLGSTSFRKKYKKASKNTLMINFDCVSDGDHMLLGISKKANQKYRVAIARAFTPTDRKQVLMENLKKIYYPSDQAGFPQAIAVAALNHKKLLGYYMDKIHTKRDTVFQDENIQYLAERTQQLIEAIS